MRVPDWWQAALLATASWRTFWLIAEDDVLARPRRHVTGKALEWLTCPYCFGFWLMLGWWAAWQAWPHGTLVVAAVFALHTGMIATYKLLASD